MTFLKEYIKHPLSVGAVAPCSARLARAMVAHVDFQNAACIVEFGPGTGVISAQVVALRKAGTPFILFEKNAAFCDVLKEKFAHEENLFIINDGAENAQAHLDRLGVLAVDYFLCGLPFASLPKELVETILHGTSQLMQNTSSFVLYQYTMFLKNTFLAHFHLIERRKVLLNLPPANVLTFQKL